MKRLLLLVLALAALASPAWRGGLLIGSGVTSAPAATVFVNDTFTNTGGSDVELSTHTGETGATWAKAYGQTLNIYNSASADDAYQYDHSGFYYSGPVYYASGNVPGSEYDVEADIEYSGATPSGSMFIYARLDTDSVTWYNAGHAEGTIYIIDKLVNGSWSRLDSTSENISVNTPVRIKLEVRNSSPKLRLLADTGAGFVEKCTSDDTAISYSSSEKVGIGFNFTGTTDVPRIDNFTATGR